MSDFLANINNNEKILNDKNNFIPNRNLDNTSISKSLNFSPVELLDVNNQKPIVASSPKLNVKKGNA